MNDRVPRVVQWLAVVIAQAAWRARAVLLNHPSPIVRLQARISVLEEDVARKTDEAENLRARIKKYPPGRRPHYSAWVRLEILRFRLRYGLSLEEAARTFVVSPGTIRRWERDAERTRPRLVEPRRPLNRLADVVEDLVQRLKIEQAAWGTRKIAHTLVRLGIKLSRRSVQRILKRPPRRRPRAMTGRHDEPHPEPSSGPLRAKRPGHIWILDLFEWRAPLNIRRVFGVGILDLYSRLPVALVAFDHHPTAREVRRVLRRAIQVHGRPRHLCSDRGPPFRAKLLIRYLARKVIRWRHGAVAKPNSIVPAVVAIDRWNQGLRAEYLAAWMVLLPLQSLQARLDRAVLYWARHRPHQGIGGRTPAEVYSGHQPKRAVDPAGLIGLRRSAFQGDGALPVYRLVRAA